jgi:hypothetical protein
MRLLRSVVQIRACGPARAEIESYPLLNKREGCFYE